MYPALAVLQALGDDVSDVLWVGGEGGMEADLVTRAGVAFTTVPAAGVHGVGLRALPGNLWKLAKGVFAARRVVRRFRPQALFFTGGFVAFPTALAGWPTPSLVFMPDIQPGLALKVVAKLASRIAVVVEQSRRYFSRPARITVTGYPTRPELTAWDRQAAFQEFDLSPDMQTLLVFGGSQGARSINRALVAVLPQLLEFVQVIHISGQLTWPEVAAARAALPPKLAARYRAYPYLHEQMGAAMTAADLVLARAGASTLGEFPLFGLPAVLVPIPQAWHLQHSNAAYLAQAGAAVVLQDERMDVELLPLLQNLLQDQQTLSSMRAAMQSIAKPHAAQEIAALLRLMASSPSSSRSKI